MSKFNLDCKVAATNAMQAARTELRLFCHIMGIADNIYNHFIGDDPYGVVDFQDGLYDFSMTDIHVVVSEYEHWPVRKHKRKSKTANLPSLFEEE